jgi:hypothetical protein
MVVECSSKEKHMKLMRAVGGGTNLKELLKQVCRGDFILLYEGVYRTFAKHPEGVVIQLNDQFLLNGETLLYEGECDGDWDVHPEGLIIRRDNQFLLNGERLICEGASGWDNWHPHPEGIMVWIGRRLMLNGERLLWEKKDRYSDDWWPHLDGFLVQIDNRILLNGEKLLYEGECDACNSHPDGALILIDNRILLNGEKLLYEGEDAIEWICDPHPEGFLIEMKEHEVVEDRLILLPFLKK